MTDLPFQIRVLTESDVDAALDIDSAAFGWDIPLDYFEEVNRPNWELDRFIGAFDPGLDGEHVGTAAIYSMSMTFPGGHAHPVAGVSWVSVRPDQHRRGILNALMRAQLDELHEQGREAVALLTASEAAIYGRYGYGPAVDRVRLVAQSGSAFRPGTVIEPVRLRPREEALPLVRGLYARAAKSTTGFLARTDPSWASLYSDHSEHRDGGTVLRFALHRDGFVAYRIKSDSDDRGFANVLTVHEICALTPVAWASLWRHVLDYGLVRTVNYRRAWVDDPLRDLIADVRSLTLPVADHVWLRLVDLDRAVGHRGYRIAANVAIGLTDAFCPWNAGSWRLDLNPAGGSSTRTTVEPEIFLDTTDLASAFLGGVPLGRLAVAGRVTGDPVAIESLAIALSTPLAPWTPEGF